jgi:hypothetical protein
VNSAIAVGVSIDRDLEVRSAGGYMVQVLPFASDETIAALEHTIPSLPSTTDMIADGKAQSLQKPITVHNFSTSLPCRPPSLPGWWRPTRPALQQTSHRYQYQKKYEPPVVWDPAGRHDGEGDGGEGARGARHAARGGHQQSASVGLALPGVRFVTCCHTGLSYRLVIPAVIPAVINLCFDCKRT